MKSNPPFGVFADAIEYANLKDPDMGESWFEHHDKYLRKKGFVRVTVINDRSKDTFLRLEKISTKNSKAVPVEVIDELASCDGDCNRRIGTSGWDETSFYKVKLSTGVILHFCETCEEKRKEGLLD
jgi:hypothetical protein